MTRKLLVMLFTCIILLALAACAGPAEPVEPTAIPPEVPAATEEVMELEEISVALVLIGPKDDNSWAEAAYTALQGVAAEGSRTTFSESVAVADVARVMREYVDEGYDVVIAHSFDYWDATFEVAAEAPDVNFAWAGGIQETAANVGDYDQPFYEPAYLAGILAGYMSESGSLGALYGVDIPVCHAMGEAMLAGALTVNSAATLTAGSVGDWGDVAAAKEAALAQVDVAGVDFWIGCGEGPTLGTIEAAKEVGGYTTGYVGDMSELGPDVVLSSIVWDMTPIFEIMVAKTADGSFDNEWLAFGVKDGALDIAINPALAGDVPQEALDALDAARAAIQDGSLVVPFVPSAEEAEPPEPAADVSVALVLIGPKDDNSWAEAAYTALQGVAAEGSRTTFSESVAVADVARVMREYVDEGYDVVIAHSFDYWDATFEVAAEAPDVNFAWAGGIQETAANVGDYDQPFYEPAYLAGILAGYMSESGSLGALYGVDIPVCHAMGEAMLAGALTVNPAATLTAGSVGDWGDVAAAKEAALAQVDVAGVDFWIGCGEGPTLGTIEAAKEVGGYTTGYVGDMSELGPDVVLSSIVWDMTPIFEIMVAKTADGSFDNEWLAFGVKDGALDIAINPALAGDVPQEALDALDAARAAIQDGSLVVPFVPE